MKNICAFLLYLVIPFFSFGKGIPIADDNFEKELICLGFDSNGLTGDILESDALKITSLIIKNDSIKNFEGIQHFKNLVHLEIRALKKVQFLDIACLSSLLVIHLENSSFTTLSMGDHPNLEVLFIDNCEAIKNVNTNGSPRLRSLFINNTSIGTLDLSDNKALQKVWITKNNKLQFLNLANGKNNDLQNRLGLDVNLCENPAMDVIIVDDPEKATLGKYPYIKTEWKKDRIASYGKIETEIFALSD